MTNLDAKGNLLPLTDPAMLHGRRNEVWHSDSSFKAVAALASLLHARVVPPVGGNTEFASARAAYAALPEERTAFCTQPQFVYTHEWREHDLVTWDNRCTLHRATAFDKTRYRRKMHRTTVVGTAPDRALASMPERAAGLSDKGPEELAAYLRSQTEKLGKVIKLLGAKVE